MRPAETLCWFGKVRSRGDFVRSARQAALTQLLDQWLSHGLAQLSADPRWKQLYDRAQAARFAVLGLRSRVALAGGLAPSMDASGRRFPFVALAAFQTGAPERFLAHAPLALEPAWRALEVFVDRACAAEDVAPVLADVPHLALDLQDGAEGWAQAWYGFATGWSLGMLQALLQRSHPGFELRRALLALGLLLQPVRRSGVARLAKGLRLPLPDRHAEAVAALWMQLLAPFLAQGGFELVLLLPRAAQPGAASLVVGFAGASPATLQALFDPQRAAEAFIELHAPAWVDAPLARDTALRRLDAQLRQDGLSLRQAVASFKDCFLEE